MQPKTRKLAKLLFYVLAFILLITAWYKIVIALIAYNNLWLVFFTLIASRLAEWIAEDIDD